MKIGLNFSDNFQTLCMVRTVRTRADLDQYDNWQIILKWHLLTCAFSWWPRAQKNSLSTNHRKANLKKKLVFFFCFMLSTRYLLRTEILTTQHSSLWHLLKLQKLDDVKLEIHFLGKWKIDCHLSMPITTTKQKTNLKTQFLIFGSSSSSSTLFKNYSKCRIIFPFWHFTPILSYFKNWPVW